MAKILETAISLEEAAKLLSRAEGHFFDAKAIELAPAKLSRTISAFANADGGEFLLGCDEQDGHFIWRGFKDVEDANAFLQVIEGIYPLGQSGQLQFLTADGAEGVLLFGEVPKSKDIIPSTDGKPYLRRGAQNLPVATEEALARLRLSKGIESFETHTVQANPAEITNSESIIEFVLEIVPHQEPEVWLRKQQLIVGELPTVAGVLMFSDEPQALLPKRSGIKIYRYKTSDDEGSRDALVDQPITIEGSVYRQIYEAVARTKQMIEGIRRMTPDGLAAVAYPDETLHEIITNAVLHRDYSIADDVHIRIYDNRVEIQSPGRLPAHVTPQNILDTRFARNGNVVRIINKFPNPPNKDVGEGLNTAFAEMEKLQLKKPIISQAEDSVLVTIRHERLASPEDSIMEYLGVNGSINNGQARELCVIREDWRIRTIFGRMVDANMIEKIPGSTTSNTAYRTKI